VNCTYEQDIDYFQPGNPSTPGANAQDCCTICTGIPGCNYFTFTDNPGTCWLKPTNDGRKDAPGLVSGGCAQPIPGKIIVNYANSKDLNNAASVAKKCTVCYCICGYHIQ